MIRTGNYVLPQHTNIYLSRKYKIRTYEVNYRKNGFCTILSYTPSAFKKSNFFRKSRKICRDTSILRNWHAPVKDPFFSVHKTFRGTNFVSWCQNMFFDAVGTWLDTKSPKSVPGTFLELSRNEIFHWRVPVPQNAGSRNLEICAFTSEVLIL